MMTLTNTAKGMQGETMTNHTTSTACDFGTLAVCADWLGRYYAVSYGSTTTEVRFLCARHAHKLAESGLTLAESN